MASESEMSHVAGGDHQNQPQSENQTATENQQQTQNQSPANLAFILPFLLGFTARAAARTSAEGENAESAATQSQIHVFFNPASGSMVIIESSGNFQSEKQGPLPASKAAIEAMPRVVVTEESCGAGGECVICLDEWEVGAEAREMPCKHRFHSGCIEKWLGMHGTCPVCRHVMPAAAEEVEEEEKGREERQTNGGEEREEGGRRRGALVTTVQAILIGGGNGAERVSGSGPEGGALLSGSGSGCDL